MRVGPIHTVVTSGSEHIAIGFHDPLECYTYEPIMVTNSANGLSREEFTFATFGTVGEVCQEMDDRKKTVTFSIS